MAWLLAPQWFTKPPYELNTSGGSPSGLKGFNNFTSPSPHLGVGCDFPLMNPNLWLRCRMDSSPGWLVQEEEEKEKEEVHSACFECPSPKMMVNKFVPCDVNFLRCY